MKSFHRIDGATGVLLRLRGILESWTLPDLLERLGAEGLPVESVVPGRVSHALDDDLAVDIYYSDDVVEYVEVAVDVQVIDYESLSPEEYERLSQVYEGKFHETVGLLRPVVGDPEFIGEYGMPGFPEEQLADKIALWNLKSCRLLVQQQHQDKELPFLITLVFEAPSKSGASWGRT